MINFYSTFIHTGLRLAMCIYTCLLRMATLLASKPRKHAQDLGYDVLLTGKFYSDNWIRTHLQPLAASRYCKRVRMVASDMLPTVDKVEGIYAPNLLTRIIGKVPSRLLLFIWIAFRDRPHIVGGFHIAPNGLIAALTARFVSARAMYICGGGPREIEGGGYVSGTRIFGKLTKPDPFIERRLLDTLSSFDIIITKGSRAYKVFSPYTENACHIIPGGFDENRFNPSNQTRDNDLIMVGHLTSIKRVDIFLQSIVISKRYIPGLSAIVLGDGPLRISLEQLAEQLMIKENVQFVGHQDNVEEWLRRSKILVLTSDSEGLAQVMVQAMLCGLPVVVSNVGDLADLVTDNVNGYLIQERTPENFSKSYVGLLNDEAQLDRFGKAAYQAAERCKVPNVALMWDEILQKL